MEAGFGGVAEGAVEGGKAVVSHGEGGVAGEGLFEGADGVGELLLGGVEAAEFEQGAGGFGVEGSGAAEVGESGGGAIGGLREEGAGPVEFGIGLIGMRGGELFNLGEDAGGPGGGGADDFAEQGKDAVVWDAAEDFGAGIGLAGEEEDNGEAFGGAAFAEEDFGLIEKAVVDEFEAGGGMGDGAEKLNEGLVDLSAFGGDMGGAIEGSGGGIGVEGGGGLELGGSSDLRQEERGQGEEAGEAHCMDRLSRGRGPIGGAMGYCEGSEFVAHGFIRH